MKTKAPECVRGESTGPTNREICYLRLIWRSINLPELLCYFGAKCLWGVMFSPLSPFLVGTALCTPCASVFPGVISMVEADDPLPVKADVLGYYS